MRRKLYCLLCSLFLLVTVGGCQIESVEQHQSKAGVQETVKKKDTVHKDQSKHNKADVAKSDKKEVGTSDKKSGSMSEAPAKAVQNTSKLESNPAQKENNSSKNETNIPENNPTPAKKKYVTISIDAKTILDNMDKLKDNKVSYVPADGVILYPTQVEIQDGDTVFTVLDKVTRMNRIQMEYQGASQNNYGSVYIQGIHQLYEFDCGELSGWMYSVNGAYVSVGASGVAVTDGQVIRWKYTCDLGKDLDFR